MSGRSPSSMTSCSFSVRRRSSSIDGSSKVIAAWDDAADGLVGPGAVPVPRVISAPSFALGAAEDAPAERKAG
jgi:hypothetical protein